LRIGSARLDRQLRIITGKMRDAAGRGCRRDHHVGFFFYPRAAWRHDLGRAARQGMEEGQGGKALPCDDDVNINR
jgi:hypothetical protein